MHVCHWAAAPEPDDGAAAVLSQDFSSQFGKASFDQQKSPFSKSEGHSAFARYEVQNALWEKSSDWSD